MRLERRGRLHLPDTSLYPFGEWYPGLPPTKFGSLRPPLPIDMLEHINTSFAFGTLELSSHRVDKFWTLIFLSAPYKYLVLRQEEHARFGCW